MDKYSSYKDSGYEDIKEIPSDWNSCKIQNLFDVVCGATPSEDNSNWNGNIAWIGPADMMAFGTISGGKRSITQKGYNSCGTSLVPKDSIVLSTRAPIGKIALAEKELCTNQGCKCLVPKDKCNTKYFAYFLFSIIERLEEDGTGTTFKELSTSALKNEPVPQIPIKLQTLIVEYLDERVSQIDSLISEAKASIEEYKQWKSSIIYEAVTKGLDPNAEMKDSGVEWIGKYPSSWQLSKIKNGYETVLGKMLCPDQRNENDSLENYLCAANIKWHGINKEVNKQMWFSSSEKQQYLLNDGDVVVMEGGLAGTASIYHNEFSPCYIQNSVHKCTAKNDNINRFLYYWLFVSYNGGYIDSICNRATIQHYTAEKLANTPMLFPPTDVQKTIADYLDSKCFSIDSIITEKEELISDLESYKKSLIYEVVTGKRKVF